MQVAYIGTENSLTVTFLSNGNSYNIDSANPNWDVVLERLEAENYEGLEELLSVKKAITTYAADVPEVEIDDVGVKYNGQYVSNYLTNKMVAFAAKKFPVKALSNFFKKVMQNPSHRAVNELYKFLEHGNMPILDNGNFIGYKSVRDNFKDWHTGKYDNSVGNVLTMPRNEVCDDPNEGCSYGFHVGTIQYAQGFNSGTNIVLVEVDPANVVSVPHDCNHQKLRTSSYKVVGLFQGKLDNDYDSGYSSNDDEDNEDLVEDNSDEIERVEEEIAEVKSQIAAGLFSDGDDLRELADQLSDLEDELRELTEGD